MPVSGKGSFEMPGDHVNALERVMAEVTDCPDHRLAGTRGLPAPLSWCTPQGSVWMHIVTTSEDHSEAVFRLLSRSGTSVSTASSWVMSFGGGFTGYIRGGQSRPARGAWDDVEGGGEHGNS